MKATGIVRSIDDLGRVVLPIELRKVMSIQNKDKLEIYVDDSMIILKKYQPSCIFCGECETVSDFKGKNVCNKCLKEIKKS